MLPFPVSLNDVRAIYELALNYGAKGMCDGLSAQGAEMMARHIVNATRVAAGIEALINIHAQQQQ